MGNNHMPTIDKIENALLDGEELTITGMVEKFNTPHGATYIKRLREQGIPIVSIPKPRSTRVLYRIPPDKLAEQRAHFGLE